MGKRKETEGAPELPSVSLDEEAKMPSELDLPPAVEGEETDPPVLLQHVLADEALAVAKRVRESFDPLSAEEESAIKCLEAAAYWLRK